MVGLLTADEFQQAIAKERRAARLAAKEFADACQLGRLEAFHRAVDTVSNSLDGWRLAMMAVAKLPPAKRDIRLAFLDVWIESKMLPLMVGNRRILSDALRVLMPCDYRGGPLRLFRGTRTAERSRRLYGFSWTSDIEIARDKFAQHWRDTEGHAIVLETLAPSAAVFVRRENENYYDEGEVIIDPFLLEKITIAGRL